MYLQLNCNRLFGLSVETSENLAKNTRIVGDWVIDTFDAVGLPSTTLVVFGGHFRFRGGDRW